MAAMMTLSVLVPVQADAAKQKQGKVLKIDFSTPVGERAGGGMSINVIPPSISTDGSQSLLSIIRAIDNAATDEKIGMIYFSPDDLSAGLSQTEELRAALSRFRQAGKKVYAYCHNLSTKQFYLASVADTLVLDPASENIFIGMSQMSFYLKDIIDTLGIDVQLIRHGKYKSAGEMFVRSESSEENREQNLAMLHAMWNTVRDESCASRGIKPEDFDSWVDGMALTSAKTFQEKGLVDKLWYKDQMDSCLCSIYGVPAIGSVPYVTAAQYASKLKKGSSKSKIAVIYANGEISMDGSEVAGPKLAADIAKVRQDQSVKAVVFRVNSPGGSVQASEAIRREIELLMAEKPVIASYGEYAASGGYWISAAADRIYTDNTTLTGSIGCFSMIPSFGDAIREKLHVNIETLGSHSHSDAVTGMRKLDDTEVAFFQAQIEEIYDQFTTIVSDGRGMEKTEVDALGQGRVWAGSDALENGLCDLRGGLADAIAFAADTAGVEEYRLVQYPKVTSFSITDMLMGKSDKKDETVTSSASQNPVQAAIDNAFPVAATIRAISEPGLYVRMPEMIYIK